MHIFLVLTNANANACIALQITEKLYRQLEPRTKKLRFTVPFPLLAFPVYLVCCCLLGAEINKLITS